MATLQRAPFGQSRVDKTFTLYFAYGSNLSLAQMARRCPESEYVGLATLPDYRWHINERGYANVLFSPRRSVPGLAFYVNKRDEAALDRCEGVGLMYYQKKELPIKLAPHPRYSGKLTSDVGKMIARTMSQGSSRSQRVIDLDVGAHNTQEVRALVYVSEFYVKDGPIKGEYIGRIREGVQHAMALGLPRQFVEQVIAPHLVGNMRNSAAVNRSRSSTGNRGHNPAGVVIDAEPPARAPSRGRRRSAPKTTNAREEEGEAEEEEEEKEPTASTKTLFTLSTHAPTAVLTGDVGMADACHLPGCQHGGDGRICLLLQENRQPHVVTGSWFHDDVLTLLHKQRTCNIARDPNLATSNTRSAGQSKSLVSYTAGLEVQKGKDWKRGLEKGIGRETATGADGRWSSRFVYSVVTHVPLIDHEVSYSIEHTTKTLSLANELAMKQFRDLHSSYWDGNQEAGSQHNTGGIFDDWNNWKGWGGSSSQEGIVIGPPVKAAEALMALDEPGKCMCAVDENECLFFSATLPENGGHVRVWVTKQELLDWE